MKILVIVDSFPPLHGGGYELRCKDVIDRLIQKGHSVKIISTKAQNHDNKNHQEKDFYRVLHSEDNSKPLYRRIYYDYQDIKFLDEIIKSYKPDVIYLWHTINLTRTIFPYLSERNTPIVYDEGGYGLSYAYNHHGAWYYFVEYKNRIGVINFLKHHIARLISKISNGLLKSEWKWPFQIHAYFNSDLNRKVAQNRGLPLDHYPIIHSGIDLNRFKIYRHKDFTPPITILVPGRIEPLKGQLDSIYLLSLLREKLDARVILIGKVRYPDYYNKILATIRELSLEPHVDILPMKEQSELIEFYQQSDFASSLVTIKLAFLEYLLKPWLVDAC